ncbi:MAG: hypothetical protein U1E39_15830 [Planctomycetota bacterium]
MRISSANEPNWLERPRSLNAKLFTPNNVIRPASSSSWVLPASSVHVHFTSRFAFVSSRSRAIDGWITG